MTQMKVELDKEVESYSNSFDILCEWQAPHTGLDCFNSISDNLLVGRDGLTEM